MNGTKPNFDSSLSSKIKWSKNILEERGSPEQIIMGSADPLVCPLLNLASIYLETALCSSQGRSGKLYGQRGRRRQRKAIVDSYMATTLPYPDAFTAAKLCGLLGLCKNAI